MTLLFHCDESYDDQYHLHLGVLSTGEQAAEAGAAVNDLVRRITLDLRLSAKELHGHPLFSGCDEWEGVRPDVRVDVYRRAIDIIGENDLEILYRGINSRRYREKYSASFNPRRDVFKFTFGDLLKDHLNRRCRARDEYALVITDRQNQYSDDLRYAHHVTMARSGVKQGEYGIVDTCHFVDSEHSPLVQIADLAAFVRRRRLSIPALRE